MAPTRTSANIRVMSTYAFRPGSSLPVVNADAPLGLFAAQLNAPSLCECTLPVYVGTRVSHGHPHVCSCSPKGNFTRTAPRQMSWTSLNASLSGSLALISTFGRAITLGPTLLASAVASAPAGPTVFVLHFNARGAPVARVRNYSCTCTPNPRSHNRLLIECARRHEF